MVWQPTRWTSSQLEERRLAAARLLLDGGLSQAEIARRLGVSRSAVTRWKRRLEEHGSQGLLHRRSPGRPSHLSAAQWCELLSLLERGAIAAGFDTERWTLRRIAAVIKRHFSVSSTTSVRSAWPYGRGDGVPKDRSPERANATTRWWRRGCVGIGRG